MTDKRFDFEDEYITLDEGVFATAKNKHDAELISRTLNQLYDENEQLKQFQDRVFSWIDMHLQRLPTLRDDEFESDNEFADPSLYSGAIQILETMKIELKGDVK